MSPPADIEALAKEILVNTTIFPPFMFLESESLFDDLCTAYDRRKARPEVYEILLRFLRTGVDLHLSRQPLRRLILAAVRHDPRSAWRWPLLDSPDFPRTRRVRAALTPLVLRSIVASVPNPAHLATEPQ